MRGLASVDLMVIEEAARVDGDLIAATRDAGRFQYSLLFGLTTPAGERSWFYEQGLRGSGSASNRLNLVSRLRIHAARVQGAGGRCYLAGEYLCEFHAAEGPHFWPIDALVGDFQPFHHGQWPGQPFDPPALAAVRRLQDGAKPSFQRGYLGD